MEQEKVCPYCLIAQGKIPANIIYEDSNFVAALEIKPANAGHVILFPRDHTKSITELNEIQRQNFFSVLSRISNILQKLSNGMNILISDGEIAGQIFPHLTVNIIPRFENDNLNFLWQQKPISEEQNLKLKSVLSESLKLPLKKQEEPKISSDDIEKLKNKLQDNLTKLKKRKP
jgi:histidine triad (HIT) family protein